MNYSEFKTRLKFSMAGGMAMATDTRAILTYLKQAVENITSTTEPLSLITKDRYNYTPMRYITKDYFIRKTDIPRFDTKDDVAFYYRIDLDEKLAEAALNLVASYMSLRDNKMVPAHAGQASTMKSYYAEDKYKYLDSIGFYETGLGTKHVGLGTERPDLIQLLDAWGYLKYYSVFPKTGRTGYRGGVRWLFDWEEQEVDHQDKWWYDTAVMIRFSEYGARVGQAYEHI